MRRNLRPRQVWLTGSEYREFLDWRGFRERSAERDERDNYWTKIWRRTTAILKKRDWQTLIKVCGVDGANEVIHMQTKWKINWLQTTTLALELMQGRQTHYKTIPQQIKDCKSDLDKMITAFAGVEHHRLITMARTYVLAIFSHVIKQSEVDPCSLISRLDVAFHSALMHAYLYGDGTVFRRLGEDLSALRNWKPEDPTRFKVAFEVAKNPQRIWGRLELAKKVKYGTGEEDGNDLQYFARMAKEVGAKFRPSGRPKRNVPN